MKAMTYIERGRFALTEKPKPDLLDERDTIVMVTLGSICTSDLHIKHGSVPRAVPGITVGHEMVGVVSEVGPKVTSVKPGDRVTVNVETFCGECFFYTLKPPVLRRLLSLQIQMILLMSAQYRLQALGHGGHHIGIHGPGQNVGHLLCTPDGQTLRLIFGGSSAKMEENAKGAVLHDP